MEKFISDIPWSLLVLACLTLGLAPFSPPHIVEKIKMLVNAELVRPVDWFDLFFHGLPWILLAIKAVYQIKN